MIDNFKHLFSFLVMTSADAFEYFANLLLTNLVTTDELLMLMTAHTADQRAHQRPHDSYECFDLEKYSDEQYKHLFHFKKDALVELCELLALPDEYVGHNGIVWHPLEGTCMLLCHLCYPGHLVDLQPYFGRSPEDCSVIVNNMLSDVHHRFAHLLSSVDQPWMNHEAYCKAIVQKGSPVNNVFGFIDGTLRQICRPGVRQKEMFSGHKRCHGLKFQHIMLPNGLVCHSYGPYPGSRHDASMYGVSQVDMQLSKLKGSDGRQLAIYGDAACPLRLWLFAPFPEHAGGFDAEKAEFNNCMSPIRSAVEWGFAKLTTYFAFTNFYSNLKLHLQAIGQYFQVATLLANCHTCVYGLQVASYFSLPPLLTCTCSSASVVSCYFLSVVHCHREQSSCCFSFFALQSRSDTKS